MGRKGSNQHFAALQCDTRKVLDPTPRQPHMKYIHRSYSPSLHTYNTWTNPRRLKELSKILLVQEATKICPPRNHGNRCHPSSNTVFMRRGGGVGQWGEEGSRWCWRRLLNPAHTTTGQTGSVWVLLRGTGVRNRRACLYFGWQHHRALSKIPTCWWPYYLVV